MSLRTVDPEPINLLLSWALGPDSERLLRRMERIRLACGQVLYRAGDPIHCVYFPISAVVSLIHQMANGSMAEVAVVGNEGFVGVSLLLGAQSSQHCAITQIAGEAMRMTAAMFRAQCERRSEFRQRVIHYTESLFRQISQTAACNRLHSVEQRLCKWLLLCLDRTHHEELSLTQEFVANMLGDRRETINAVQRQLRDAGLIRCSRGRLRVLNRDGLESRACECYHAIRP